MMNECNKLFEKPFFLTGKPEAVVKVRLFANREF